MWISDHSRKKKSECEGFEMGEFMLCQVAAGRPECENRGREGRQEGEEDEGNRIGGQMICIR